MHSRHRMHSGALICWSGFNPISQILWQDLHFVQPSSSILIEKTENRLNNPKIAPKGQSILHHGLLTRKMAAKNKTITITLMALGHGISFPERAAVTTSGSAFSRAPAGHIRQMKRKCPSPKRYGTAMTATARTTYRRWPVHCGGMNFFVGIFASRS